MRGAALAAMPHLAIGQAMRVRHVPPAELSEVLSLEQDVLRLAPNGDQENQDGC